MQASVSDCVLPFNQLTRMFFGYMYITSVLSLLFVAYFAVLGIGTPLNLFPKLLLCLLYDYTQFFRSHLDIDSCYFYKNKSILH